MRNREAWDGWASEYLVGGRKQWATDDVTWGIFSVREDDLHLLPEHVSGLDTVELGCGTGYVSAWLARRGARPIGLDNSPAQLASARMFQREHDLTYPLIHADAERAPLAGESFDLAISEYGACLWCDPHRWVPEAARLLRPGGELTFLANGNILMLAQQATEAEGAAGDRLLRDYFGMHRFEWPDDDSVEFHLPHGELIALLRRTGFEIEELIEVQPPPDATTRFPHATVQWARRWPYEEVWKVRKRG